MKPPRQVQELIRSLTEEAPLAPLSRTYVPDDPNNDFGAKLSDVHFDPVPLDYFTSPESQCAWDCHVAPKLPATIMFHLAQFSVVVLDRTGYPIAGVTVEIHSQGIGATDGAGQFQSTRFTPGTYPLKYRSPHTAPSAARGNIPSTWSHGWEYEVDTEFDVGLLEGRCVLSLLAHQLSTGDIVEQLFARTLKRLPDAIMAQVSGFFTPESAALFGALILIWAGGHLTGVSEVIDAAVVLATVAVTAYTIALTIEAINALIGMVRDLCEKLDHCEDEFDLDEAAQDLANIIAFAGIGALIEVIARIVKHVTGKITYRPSSKYIGPRQPASIRFKRCIDLMGRSAYTERANAVLSKARALGKYARLSDTQIVAIRAYTDPLVTKLGELRPDWKDEPKKERLLKDWEFVNRLLRSTETPVAALVKKYAAKDAANVETFKAAADYVDTMVEAVEALPPQRATVMRVVDGANEGMEKQLRLWSPVIEKAFASTSTNESMIVRKWSAGKEKPVILKILAWSGRPIADISAFPGQSEFLIPPGRKFIFVAKKSVRILREKTEMVGEDRRPVLKAKLVRDASGAWVPETRFNDATGKTEPVMEHVLEEVQADKYYGVELGDDMIMRVFGSGVAFRTLLRSMQAQHDSSEARHP